MAKIQNSKRLSPSAVSSGSNDSSQEKPIYDLEERTYQFAKAVRIFVKTLPKTIANIEDGKQVIKTSGFVGANYVVRK
jgi:hypothetical protein